MTRVMKTEEVLICNCCGNEIRFGKPENYNGYDVCSPCIGGIAQMQSILALTGDKSSATKERYSAMYDPDGSQGTATWPYMMACMAIALGAPNPREIAAGVAAADLSARKDVLDFIRGKIKCAPNATKGECIRCGEETISRCWVCGAWFCSDCSGRRDSTGKFIKCTCDPGNITTNEERMTYNEKVMKGDWRKTLAEIDEEAQRG